MVEEELKAGGGRRGKWRKGLSVSLSVSGDRAVVGVVEGRIMQW